MSILNLRFLLGDRDRAGLTGRLLRRWFPFRTDYDDDDGFVKRRHRLRIGRLRVYWHLFRGRLYFRAWRTLA
jgi:hypothetical protein